MRLYGVSVFKGVLANFLGVVVLAAAKYHLFQIYFFRMFVLSIFVGAAYGFIFLPIVLAHTWIKLFQRNSQTKVEEMKKIGDKSEDKSENKSEDKPKEEKPEEGGDKPKDDEDKPKDKSEDEKEDKSED